MPLDASPRRLERGSAWFLLNKGFLCDGGAFEDESLDPIGVSHSDFRSRGHVRVSVLLNNAICACGLHLGCKSADAGGGTQGRANASESFWIFIEGCLLLFRSKTMPRWALSRGCLARIFVSFATSTAKLQAAQSWVSQ